MRGTTNVLYFMGILFIFGAASCLSIAAKRVQRSTYQNPDCAEKIKLNGIDLLNEGIRVIDSSIKISGRFFEALRDLYEHSNRDKIYKVTKNGLYRLNRRAYNHFMNSSIQSLEKKFIYVYTTKYVYKPINDCLRNHACTSKVLSDDDRKIAPFSAMLMAVLMYWPTLRQETGVVYRKITLNEQDLALYEVGVKFTWTQFISTTRNRKRAFNRSIEFIIHNGKNRNFVLGPKRVRPYAWDQSLDEVIYGPGTEYKVIKVHPPINQVTTVELEFIPPDLACNGESIYYQNKLVFIFISFDVSLLCCYHTLLT